MIELQNADEHPKSEDKKGIEIEEKEQILNAVNKTQDNRVESENMPSGEKKLKQDGMEVKPKKIPIGGIQMPGFFTRSRSKEKCKDELEPSDVEENELIEQREKEKNEHNTTQTRIKLPNPFRKSKVSADEEGADKVGEPKEKKTLLDTIKLPLVSVFPRKKKDDDNIENQTAQAGLASMETLDDKSNEGKTDEDLKNVALDQNNDVEKQNIPEESTWRQHLKTYRVAISAVLVFFLLIIIIIAIAIPGIEDLHHSQIRDGKYIETSISCGNVEGIVEDSAMAFRGIPYARPPTGDLRFKYAQPLDDLKYCWNGTFLAHNGTDTCLQIHSDGSTSGIEDCLTLDVVTPYVRCDKLLPVIVLIGADSLTGGSPGKMRPSARYARAKDVVFVRPNFRLGALGFLALDTLSDSDYPHRSGNYGLSDILAALEWVQLNIDRFGGDRSSVTLFGHRAGATLVTALTTIKKADKYFARAWASSGGAIYPKKLRVESEIDNRRFLDRVQCQNAKCLRKVDAVQLLNAVEDSWRKPPPDLPSIDENPEKAHEWLVMDGDILREHPATVWANEELPVKLILGTTAHSGASEALFLKQENWTDETVRQHISASFLTSQNLTDQALEMYPTTYKGLSSMISDIRIICPLFAISTQMNKVPFYVVTQTRGNQHIADIESDIDAILGRYEPKTPEQRRYVSAMQGFFYHYVWHGTVEHTDKPGHKVLVVGQDVLSNVTYSECAFWINSNVVLTYAALD